MMKIYLDTSIVSAYFDKRVPVRMNETREFWEQIQAEDVYISTLVLDELEAVSDDDLRYKMLSLLYRKPVLSVTKDVEDLAKKYVTAGIFPSKYYDDALHLSLAVINEIDILVSWNFRHLVKRKTRLEVHKSNTLYGLKQIDIIAPPEY